MGDNRIAARAPRAVLRLAVRGQTRYLLGSALLLMSHQVGESLVPVVIGVVIDRAVATADYAALALWLVVLAVVFTDLSLSYRFGARLGQHAVQYAAHDLRLRLTRRILDPAGGANRGQLTGALLNITTQDTLRVGTLNAVIAGTAAALAALVVATIVLLRISLPLGLVVLLGSPLLVVLVQLLGRPLERASGAEQAEAARSAGIATDLISGLRVLKGIGAEENAAARYQAASRGSLGATLRAARIQATYEGATLFLTGGFLAVVALVGGRLAINGQISIGELIAAVGLTQFLQGPLSRLTTLASSLAQARASAARVAALLATPAAVTTDRATWLPEPISGTIRFEHVATGRLDQLSFAVDAGEFVGIVTAEPSEMQALHDCLARASDPSLGRITLDGIPLRDLAPDAVHRAILVAAHDGDLFQGSVLDNVRIAATDPARVDAAIAATTVDEVARSLPDGLATAISEQGRSLSGGQRQRVCLARALAADPPVLALFEPTTAVDSVTEARIARGLRTLRNGKTTIVVTTSPALLAVTDRVIFIEEGRFGASGGHDELVGQLSYREAVLA